MELLRRLVRAFAVTVILFVVAVGARRATFDPAPWLADYDVLRDHTAAVYANLDWVVEHRGLDVLALDEATRAALENAGSDFEALLAIQGFVDAWDDGHVRVDGDAPYLQLWFSPSDGGDHGGTPELGPGTSATEACDRLGFRADLDPVTLDLGALPGFSRVGPPGSPFPAGTWSLVDQRRAGFVRIPIFDPFRYRAACERAWPPISCDADCRGAFTWETVPQALDQELAVVLAELADADVLVVDITGNGGGTDWADSAARLFSAEPLECPKQSFSRHPVWATRIDERLELVNGLGGTNASERALLGTAKRRLGALQRELGRDCDRSGVWTGEATCSSITTAAWSACGPLSYAPPGSFSGVEERYLLFRPLGLDFRQGAWTGPLALLVDRRTASASEHFAAMLVDHGDAVVIGERTDGSGCGYVGRGLPARLPNSGLEVKMPDCTRWRANGDNELAGVEPGIPLPWSTVGAAERSRRLTEALSQVR